MNAEEIISLTSEEKTFLCRLARETLERQFNDKISSKISASGNFKMKKPVFVTL
jgi:AMMECR1 domain-containing protein